MVILPRIPKLAVDVVMEEEIISAKSVVSKTGRHVLVFPGTILRPVLSVITLTMKHTRATKGNTRRVIRVSEMGLLILKRVKIAETEESIINVFWENGNLELYVQELQHLIHRNVNFVMGIRITIAG